jgi:hypothetical protein
MGFLVPEEGWLGRFVSLYASRTEASEEAFLAAGLAALSAAVGARLRIRWADLHGTELCNVWCLLVGGSGSSHKSTVMGAAQAIAKEAAAQAGTAARLRTASIGHASGAGVLMEVGTENAETAEEWETTLPPGWLLDCDEAGALFGRRRDEGGGRDADWRGDTRSTMLALYGGRIGGALTRKSKIVPSPCSCSALGNATRPDLLERVSLATVGTGWAGRWLLIADPGTDRSIAVPLKWSHDERAERAWLVATLSELAHRTGIVDDVWSLWTPEAIEARQAWYSATRTRLRPEPDGGDEVAEAMFALFSRLQATAVKLAVLRAVSDQWRPGRALGPEDGGGVVVDTAEAVWGQVIVERTLRWWSELLTAAAADAVGRWQRQVVGALDRAGGELAHREVFRSTSTRLSYEVRVRALYALANADVVALEEGAGSHGGRRVRLLSNPYVDGNGHP